MSAMKDPVTVALIGCNGAMGAMLRQRWRRAGITVHGVDRSPGPGGAPALDLGETAKAVVAARVVMLAVPTPAVPEVMAVLHPFLRPDQILSDVCSVKLLPLRWMREAFSGPIVGAHPLFGPDNGMENQRVALVRDNNATDEDRALLASLFQAIGCETFQTTAEEHDRACAVAQSLHFALNAAYFSLVSRQENLEPYITPSFIRYREAARKELTVNAPMFCEFTAANPLFNGVLDELRRLLRETGADGLRSLAAEAEDWLAARPPVVAAETAFRSSC